LLPGWLAHFVRLALRMGGLGCFPLLVITGLE
jgi:hypothetical protein